MFLKKKIYLYLVITIMGCSYIHANYLHTLLSPFGKLQCLKVENCQESDIKEFPALGDALTIVSLPHESVRVLTMFSLDLGASVLGSFSAGFIYINSRAFNFLTYDAQLFVCLHELGHLHHRHTDVGGLLTTFFLPAANLLMASHLLKDNYRIFSTMLHGTIAAWYAFFLWLMWQSSCRLMIENEADTFAIQQLLGIGKIDAIEQTIESRAHRQDTTQPYSQDFLIRVLKQGIDESMINFEMYKFFKERDFERLDLTDWQKRQVLFEEISRGKRYTFTSGYNPLVALPYRLLRMYMGRDDQRNIDHVDSDFIIAWNHSQQ